MQGILEAVQKSFITSRHKMHAPTVAQQNPTGLPKSEILPLCCRTSELLRPADVGGYRGRGYPWVQNGQQIKRDTAEARERDVPSNFCNITVVDAGEVHGEQMAEGAGLTCCLLLPLLESARD